jgi:hypothetical protein
LISEEEAWDRFNEYSISAEGYYWHGYHTGIKGISRTAVAIAQFKTEWNIGYDDARGDIELANS